MSEFAGPFRWNGGVAVKRASQLAVNGTGGISVVTQVDCLQAAITKTIRVIESPQCCFQRTDDITGTFDVGRIALTEGTARDLVDLWRERVMLPIVWDGRVSS